MHMCLGCSQIKEEFRDRLSVYGYRELRTFSNHVEETLDRICEACFCEYRSEENECSKEKGEK